MQAKKPQAKIHYREENMEAKSLDDITFNRSSKVSSLDSNEMQSDDYNHTSILLGCGQSSATNIMNQHGTTQKFNLLQPAKLKIDNSTSKSFSIPPKAPILRPSKLINTNIAKCNLTKHTIRTVLNAQNVISSNTHSVSKYMKYLQIMQSVKKYNAYKSHLYDLARNNWNHSLLQDGKSKKNAGGKKTNQLCVDSLNVPNRQTKSTINSQSIPLDKAETVGAPSDIKFMHVVENDSDEGNYKSDIENDHNNAEVQNLYLMEATSLLSSMFPHIDEKNIKDLCIKNFERNGYTTDYLQLQNVIDELLLDNTSLSSSDSESQSDSESLDGILDETTYNVQRSYTYLINIFPNADPTYIKSIATSIHHDPSAIAEFIHINLENPSYPTKEKYLENKRIAKLQKQYTDLFSVQKFLKIFPDPFTFFMDPERNCIYSDDALKFLIHQFHNVHEADIKEIYANSKYQLTLTVEEIKRRFPCTHRLRKVSLPATKDIALLQEIAFLEHKEEIQDFLTNLKEKENTLFRELKTKNRLVECQCCYDNQCIPSKCAQCEKGHLFCNACILKGTEVQLSNGESHIPCFTHCDSEFSLAVLKRIIPPQKFSILLKKRQEAEVNAAGLEGLVSCPFCHFASIPPPEDKVFKCLNRECMKESCRNCKELNHLPLKCNETRTEQARLMLEEKMTEALIRKCHKCGRPFFKEDGCNKITCPCGAVVCYVCDTPVTGYDHFAGQGSTNTTLCPLFSDDYRLNTEVVRQVAKKTLDYIKQQDPEVALNASDFLPTVPKPSLGAHDYVQNADAVLDRRVTKIAKFDKGD